MFKLLVISGLVAAVLCQYQGGNYASQNQLTTPHPRNYHPPAPVHYVNIGTELAGDYKFGYDTGKGPLGQSFREETRLADGTVKGAYGILDEQGKQRIIRYTAGKNGFVAEGDGLAPAQAPAPQAAPAQAYRAPPQQYNPAPAQQYNPPQQQYNPPQQQYNPPQQYRPQQQQSSRQYRNDGQWDPKADDDYYNSGPAFIDVERLSYNIGTAKQG